MVRGEYRPPRRRTGGAREEAARAFVAGSLTVDELVRRYCTLVFAQKGNYQETARRLRDRRADREGEGGRGAVGAAQRESVPGSQVGA